MKLIYLHASENGVDGGRAVIYASGRGKGRCWVWRSWSCKQNSVHCHMTALSPLCYFNANTEIIIKKTKPFFKRAPVN